jgi:hypothetical protein
MPWAGPGGRDEHLDVDNAGQLPQQIGSGHGQVVDLADHLRGVAGDGLVSGPPLLLDLLLQLLDAALGARGLRGLGATGQDQRRDEEEQPHGASWVNR